MMRRVLLFLVVTAVGLAALAPPVLATEVAVVLRADGASPPSLVVDPGSRITFHNDDDRRHRMRARDPEDVDTSDIDPGTSVTVGLSVSGTYRFVDERTDDPAFEVTITVSDDQSGPGTKTAPEPGAQPDQDREAAPPSSVEVSIPDRRFSPGTVRVAVGATVTWVNLDDDHTVTARDGSFDSGIFGAGARFTRAFTAPGTVEYLCRLHPEMTGTVEVIGEASTSGPTPSPAPPSPEPEVPPSTPDTTPPTSDTDPSSSGRAVDIVDLAFSPSTVTVAPGTTLTWTNRGRAPHTVTSQGGGPLDSGVLDSGDAYRLTLTTPGTYDYLCTIHPEMTGRVVVGSDEPDGADAASALATVTPEDRPAATSPTPGPTAVRVVDFVFDPDEVTVEPGTSVTWTNLDVAPHTVTSTDGGPLDSGILETDGTYQVTFDEPGTYGYHCDLHPEMTGRVVVGAPDASATDSSPPDAEDATAEGPTVRALPSGTTNGDAGSLPIAAGILLLGMVAAFIGGRLRLEP